jgi:predicted RND superfamily exporter protein
METPDSEQSFPGKSVTDFWWERNGRASLKRVTRYLTRRPWVATLLLVGLTITSLIGVTHVTIDAANERLFIRHSTSYRVYQRFLDAFGSDEAILVALYDPGQSLLKPAGVAAIRRLTKALADLPQVASVLSLITAPDMARLRPDPFATDIPRLIKDDTLSPAQVASLRDNPQLVGTLLSADLHAAGFLVIPEHTIDRPAREQWIADVRAVAARHAGQGRQTYVAGTPLERYDVARYIEHDQRLIVPLVLLVLLGTTWCIYRIKRLALIPFVAVLLSLSWTMGILASIPRHHGCQRLSGDPSDQSISRRNRSRNAWR